MITAFLIKALLSLFTVLTGWIAIPAMPVFITAGFGYVLDFIVLPLKVTKAYIGHEFFIAVITAIVVLMSLERTWATVQWLWHKIRG